MRHMVIQITSFLMCTGRVNTEAIPTVFGRIMSLYATDQLDSEGERRALDKITCGREEGIGQDHMCCLFADVVSVCSL